LLFAAVFLFFVVHNVRIFRRAVPGPAIRPDEAVLDDVTRSLYLGFDTKEGLGPWKEHSLKGRTDYTLLEDEGGQIVLHAESAAASSALFREAKLPIAKRPVLRWEWRALGFPSGKKRKTLSGRRDNDFAARIYVVFKGKLSVASEVIQYVWDDYFAEGFTDTNRSVHLVKMLVAETGVAKESGAWIPETRDLAQDYEMLFGRKAEKDVYAIGIMSDSDNTRTRSRAEFRNISVSIPSG